MLWWIAIIGLGAIFKFIYWVADCIHDSNENKKKKLTDKQNTLTEKRCELVREINKLKTEQQGVLNQWKNSIYEGKLDI